MHQIINLKGNFIPIKCRFMPHRMLVTAPKEMVGPTMLKMHAHGTTGLQEDIEVSHLRGKR